MFDFLNILYYIHIRISVLYAKGHLKRRKSCVAKGYAGATRKTSMAFIPPLQHLAVTR